MFDRKKWRREYYQKRGREYYQKNRKKRLKQMKKYYENNKDKILKQQKGYLKEYYIKNKSEILKQQKEHRKNNLKSWEGFISLRNNCQICGKEIYFNKRNRNNAIHFDHKSENVPIKINPSEWLIIHKKTSKTQKIWESCNFGVLCSKCNSSLPTKNRRQFVINSIRYIFGDIARTQFIMKVLKELEN